MLFVDFLDELAAGIPVTDGPAIRTELGLQYGEASWFLLALPLALAIVLETPLLLLSDRWSRQRMLCAALAAMGVCLGLAALAPSAWLLGLAIALWAAAGGVGCGVAQGALMAAFPDDKERMMTRWTLSGTIGDLATPALIFGLAALGFDWRVALAVAGGLHLMAAVAIAAAPFPPPVETASDEDGDEDSIPLTARLRQGFRNRRLMLWLFAGSLCCLLDEILILFGTLSMRDRLGGDLTAQVALVFAGSAGYAIGLLVTDRLLTRVRPLTLLVVGGVAATAAYAAWVATTSIPASIALLAVVGLFSAPFYPIASAQAFRACPGRPGVVNAVDQVFAPVAVLSPLVLGWLADTQGLVAALAVLVAEPVGVAVVALVLRRRD